MIDTGGIMSHITTITTASYCHQTWISCTTDSWPKLILHEDDRKFIFSWAHETIIFGYQNELAKIKANVSLHSQVFS